jgi:DNA-binding transcriptional MocR family regulator
MIIGAATEIPRNSGHPPPGLVLGYGAIPTDRIDEGLDRLRRCFED